MSKLNLYIWRHYCLDMSYVSVIYQVRCGAGVVEEIPREHAEQVSGASFRFGLMDIEATEFY